MDLYLYYYCYILHYFLGQEWPIVAVATVKTPNGLNGNVTFSQEYCTGPVKVKAVVEGLSGCHGFHIHELGDLTEGCASLKGHWNPSEENHGHHAGDLPQLCVLRSSNTAYLEEENYTLKLVGPLGIVGRSVVVHANSDDFGLGGTEVSRTTGSAGPRIGCGVIGLKTSNTPKIDTGDCSYEKHMYHDHHHHHHH